MQNSFLTALNKAALLGIFLMAAGCKGAPARDTAPLSEPKSGYGQAVKKSKDAGAELEKRDNQIQKQTEGLFEE